MKKYLQPSAGGTKRTCPETGTGFGAGPFCNSAKIYRIISIFSRTPHLFPGGYQARDAVKGE